MSFVHLQVHSQYSLLEATCTIEGLVKKAKSFEMPALALTDFGNMFGAIEFYFGAKDAGIKPLLGLEAYIAPQGRLVKGDATNLREPNRRIVLLAQNLQGYRNLCEISSIGYKEGFYYRPRIDYEILKKFNSDLIALSGSSMGDVPWTFVNRGADAALEKIKSLKEIYDDRFYLQLCRPGIKEWETTNQFLIEASKITGVPMVAANDVHFVEPEDQIAQEVLICIGSNKTLQDETRYKLGSDQFYLKSPAQMRQIFKDLPEVCDRSLEIAERCNLQIKVKDDKGQPIYHLPSYPTSGGASLTDEMRRLSLEGLEDRFQEARDRGEEVPEEKKNVYKARIDFELKVIDQMGFNGYFLIVQDFINWAKTHEIPVGPGRGSGAGSLVAYCQKITDLDPMPYNLIFERFLNPERVSMPDFDIDFCQEHRGRVIDYVTNKYGEASVSQIITYGKLQARAAVRDVGRVLGMTYGEVDVVAKLIPEKLGITLKEAIETEERMSDLMESDPKINTLMELAQKIEGLVRHAGIHAAGVIIADGEIVKHAPLYRGVAGENVVQYDMKHAEKIGLIKFDFLGLKTLTHIQEAFRLIEKSQGKVLRSKDISLKDPGIYNLMSRGDTAGIFQFEGEGITDLIRKAQPDCFEDIVAINALYRPGPMDMIPDYVERKRGGKKVEYAFKELEEVTKETYGIIIYQEQVQLIAAKIANYSLGEADMLRRAMGKKIPEVMAKQKDRFMAGAAQNNFDAEKASELFDSMAEFAKYGFNKSHAAAYCVVAAHTAYLKNYYPVEFFAALLTTDMSDTDKIVKYVKDARSRGIEVRPPHINYSDFKFSVHEGKILFSLGAIKGVGEAAVESILEARAQCPEQKFSSLEDFFAKVDLRRVNKKTIECLIKSGGLDGFGYDRASLLSGYGTFIERCERIRNDREVGQTSLFALETSDQEQESVILPKASPWTRSETLAYEKEVLGFYLSDHPLQGLTHLVRTWVSGDLKQLKEKSAKQKVVVLGMISSMKEIITKKGTRMAFAQFEDMSDHLELIIFPNVYATAEHLLKSEQALLITGNLEKKDEESDKIIVESCEKLETHLLRAKKMVLQLNSEVNAKMALVQEVFLKYPGTTPMSFVIDIPELSKKISLDVQEPRGVSVNSKLIENLYSVLGDTKQIQIF